MQSWRIGGLSRMRQSGGFWGHSTRELCLLNRLPAGEKNANADLNGNLVISICRECRSRQGGPHREFVARGTVDDRFPPPGTFVERQKGAGRVL